MPDPLPDVHLLALNSWDQISRGLESNEINAAFINIPLAMALASQGMDIAMLMFTHRGGSRMICPPGVKQITDFKGKSVLIPHKLSVQHMLLHKFMDARGMGLKNVTSPKSVCAEAVPPFLMPEMTARDKTGDIAAFICEAPFGTQAVEQGQARQLLSTQDLWPDHPSSAFVVHHSLLENRGKDIQTIVHAFFCCAAFMDTRMAQGKNFDDAIQPRATEFLKQPDITANALESAGVSYTPSLLVPDIGLLDIIHRYMGKTMGLIGPLDLNQFIMPAFGQDALGKL